MGSRSIPDSFSSIPDGKPSGNQVKELKKIIYSH